MKNIKQVRKNLTKSMTLLFAAGALVLSPHAAQAGDTTWMHGGNYADKRDNFVDGTLVLTGLRSSSGRRSYQNKANQIAEYGEGIGMNIIRLPVNPATVAHSKKWPRYKALIDRLISKGMNVVLAYWEGDSSKDGQIDDYDDWQTMWETIDGTYKNNRKVYFEPFNEPHGYGTNSLKNIYKDFRNFTDKGDGFIILDGTGYAHDVTGIGGDNTLKNCKLTIHVYSWFANNNQSGWHRYVEGKVGNYADRTLVSECGANATSGRDYMSSSSSNAISMIRGVTSECREEGMGFICWPAWRDGDSFRLFNNTSSDDLTNESLKDIFRWAWGF